MMTREEAEAIYHAGPEAVVRVLLEMDVRLDASQQRVRQLEERLAKDSHNSSKPPSSDGLSKPKPKSLRSPSGRPTGGQPGHSGRTLRMVEKPDCTVFHPVNQCAGCGCSLTGQPPDRVERRQVFASARAETGGHRAPGRNQNLRLRMRQPRRVSTRGHGSRAIWPSSQERGRLCRLS